jgi:hypothetical protein
MGLACGTMTDLVILATSRAGKRYTAVSTYHGQMLEVETSETVAYAA